MKSGVEIICAPESLPWIATLVFRVSAWMGAIACIGFAGRLEGAVTNLVGKIAMHAPPTVTLTGPTNSTPSIAGAVLIGPADRAFRYSGADARAAGASYPWESFFRSYGITGLYASLPYLVQFDTDASEFELLLLGTQGQYRVKVDGEYVSLNVSQGPPGDGNFYWLKLAFPDRLKRAILIEFAYQTFGGVAIKPSDQLLPPEKLLGPRCIVLGDSYTEPLVCYARRLDSLMSWEVWNSGVGGTGYVNPGPSGRVKFGDRAHSDVIANHPDIVIVAGGINDNSYLPEEVHNAALALYDQLLTNLPSAKIVVLGPWWPSGRPIQSVLDTRDAIKQAALARGLAFIDPIVATNISQVNAGWITGTGNAANSRGDGNADEFISVDGTHPTDLGHQFLAFQLAMRLKNMLVSDPTPRVGLQLFAGVEIHGRVGRAYRIQRSDTVNSQGWTDLATLTLESNPQSWIDPDPTGRTNRYYRAILLP